MNLAEAELVKHVLDHILAEHAPEAHYSSQSFCPGTFRFFQHGRL